MTTLIDTILDIAERPAVSLPKDALKVAQLSLFDWLLCGQIGIGEPLAEKLRALANLEKGTQSASIFGDEKYPTRMAALVNGATSHAIDFDDTHFAHVGHLSVGIYPAALAAGEQIGASASEVVAAFLLGAEAAIRVGIVLGTGHYNRGFHQTASAGAFGATVAAGRLYGLTRAQMRAAIGLCATRSSGLKCQFGTMGKPYNAGLAAANGVECAQLAGLGMTSCDDGLMGPQGFVETHSDAPLLEIASADQFLFSDVSYKFHACCHGTHAMIEALLKVCGDAQHDLDSIAGLRLRTNPRWLSVCDVPNPATGLEVKFSYRWLAGMVLRGMETGSFDTYTDALAADSQLSSFARKIDVTGDATITDMQAEGEITFQDGRVMAFAHDLSESLAPEEIEAKLRLKAENLLGADAAVLTPVLGVLADMSAADIGQLVRTKA